MSALARALAEGGKMMAKGRTLLFVIASCLWGLQAHPAVPQDCELKRLATVDLIVNAHGRFLVPVTIAGTAALMSLQTENFFSAIRLDAAQKLGLKLQNGPVRVRGPSEKDAIQKMVIATDFALGPAAHFKKAEFIVVTSSGDGDETIGGLGYDMLSNLDVELDLANNKMYLYAPAHCPDNVVYWANEFSKIPISIGTSGQPYFPMELAGKPLETMISTGSETTTVPTDLTKQLFGFDDSSSDVQTRSDSDGKKTYHYRAMELGNAQNLRVINADIRLEKSSHANCQLKMRAGAWGYDMCVPGHPLRLGRNVLTKLHLYIAVKEKALYFTSAQVAPLGPATP